MNEVETALFYRKMPTKNDKGWTEFLKITIVEPSVY